MFALRGARWDSIDTDHFRLYVQPGSYAAGHVPALRLRAEHAWTHDLALLNARTYPYRIHVFYFDSAAQMQVAGAPGGGMAIPEAHTVMLQAFYGPFEAPPDVHEIMHELSLTLWGLNHADDVWQREGLATLASADEWAYGLDQMAAQALRNGDRRTIGDLAGNGFFAGTPMQRFHAYMFVGSFVQYLIRIGGLDRFHALWQSGSATAPAIYGTDLGVLSTRWTATLQSIELPAGGIDLDLMRRCGRTPGQCGHESSRSNRDSASRTRSSFH